MNSSDYAEVFGTVRWVIEDLEYPFEKYGIPFTRVNVDRFLMSRAPKILCDISIQQGWEILDDLVAEFSLDLCP